MLVWLVGWMELTIMDGVAVISMAPRIDPGYMVWLMMMQPGPLGLDELFHNSERIEIPSLRDEEPMNVENPIHDEPLSMDELGVPLMVSPTLGNIWL